jgi:uncharacterized protein YraI
MSLSPVDRSSKLLASCLLALLLLGAGALQGPVAAAYLLLQAPAAVGLQPTLMTRGTDVRSGPGEHYLVLTIAEAGEQYAILGRSGDGLWWRIDFHGRPAWVAAARVQTQATGVPVVRVGGERL